MKGLRGGQDSGWEIRNCGSLGGCELDVFPMIMQNLLG